MSIQTTSMAYYNVPAQIEMHVTKQGITIELKRQLLRMRSGEDEAINDHRVAQWNTGVSRLEINYRNYTYITFSGA